jgi:ubiquinone/menaquinone biosynthesis C-methylase UbiE
MTVDYFNVRHPLHPLKQRLALRARKRMFSRVMAFARPTRDMRVVDVGATPDLTLSYNNFFERWYPNTDRVTACSIEDCSALEAAFPGLTFVPLSGRTLPFRDAEFDLAVSFAVLEHVGSEDQQRYFLTEMARIARSFVAYTPYRYFPVEMHTLLPFLHWLPVRTHRALLRALGMTFWADEQNLHLLSIGDVKRVLPANGHSTVRFLWTMGWPSNIEILWTRDEPGAGAPAD